ncbi:MAG: magnesium-translocating P-type ATPase [Microbacteriaceae bacterium]
MTDAPIGEVDASTGAGETGLTSAQAAAALERTGPNTLARGERAPNLQLLARQFLSPIVIILAIATILSAVLGDVTDAVIILTIILASGLLSFFQERGAGRQMTRLLASVESLTTVLRDGHPVSLPPEKIVPGDVCLLALGDLVPADGIVVESLGLALDESSLTGETFPAEKRATSATALDAGDRVHAAFLGSHVVAGRGRVVVSTTGQSTELGRLTSRLTGPTASTGFEIGMTSFGLLLTRAMVVLVVVIFLTNLLLHRPLIDSALFSLALAVGLTPQLLPAIVSISLARGARTIAAQRVIVRRLDAIEDFGSINVLCSDKTGTLTEGRVTLAAAMAASGEPSENVRRLAALNAGLQVGLDNPIDRAIIDACTVDRTVTKLGELAYDFDRRLLSVVVSSPGAPMLITKGALDAVLRVCDSVDVAASGPAPIAEHEAAIRERFAQLSAEGFRVLGVAHRDLASSTVTLADEAGMTFAGFVTFADPVKADSRATVANFAASGVSVRMLTGDNHLVATHIASAVGLDTATALTGADIELLTDAQLPSAIRNVAVFSELNPLQKERLIIALRADGNTVGYLGDGINDAPALRSADVGISVDSAVAVAKEAAAIVLLDKDLSVLLEGMRQGRRTFANTMKYIFMTTSANFGNMLSMAIASIILPFLPLLAGQILLVNLLTDLPATTIATDSVDASQLRHPQKWNIRLIRNYMIVFGALSSVFDLTTFAVLRWGMNAGATEFRSAWFVGSVLTEVAVLFVLRTRGPFYRSRPARGLVWSSVLVAIATLAIPFSPVATPLGMRPLPLELLLVIIAITLGYVAATEGVKHVFWRENRQPTAHSLQKQSSGSGHAHT